MSFKSPRKLTRLTRPRRLRKSQDSGGPSKVIWAANTSWGRWRSSGELPASWAGSSRDGVFAPHHQCSCLKVIHSFVWRCSPMMTDPHYLNPPCQHSLITLELHWCARHTNAIFPGPALVSTAGEYVQHWTFITSSVTLTPRLLHFFRLLWKFLHNPPCPLPPPWCTKSSIFYYNTYYAVSLKVQEYI